MAAAPDNKEDLSMEEILQSIRKIISDDDNPQEAGETTMADEATSANEEIEAEGSDVLELTDMMEEVVEEPIEAVDILQEIDDALDTTEEPVAQEVEDTTQEIEDAPVQEEAVEEVAAIEPPVVQETASAVSEVSEADRLLSDNAATASAASLQKVVATHKSANPSPGFRSGTSVEELVLESLKPMLKDWLDTNLPSMVERIVEREIRKLVD